MELYPFSGGHLIITKLLFKLLSLKMFGYSLFVMAVSHVHALTLHLQLHKLCAKHYHQLSATQLWYKSEVLGFFLYQTYKIKLLSLRTLSLH